MTEAHYYTMMLEAKPGSIDILKHLESIWFNINMPDGRKMLYLVMNEEKRVAYDEWSTCEDDLIWLSSWYPNTLFSLYGQSWELQDIWVRYFKDGKTYMDYPTITFGDFNQEKLV